jgi:hypothetical protein
MSKHPFVEQPLRRVGLVFSRAIVMLVTANPAEVLGSTVHDVGRVDIKSAMRIRA